MKFLNFWLGSKTFKLILPIIILFIIGFSSEAYLNLYETKTTITINEKSAAHGEDGKYLIFTEDEVFTVEDNIFKLKFDASDRYNNLKVGKTYNITCTGMRIHVFSMYRNIISFEEVNS